MQRLTFFLLVIFLCGIAAATMIYYWPEIQRHSQSDVINRDQEAKDLTETEKLIESSRPMKAASLIKKYSSEIEKNTPTGEKWLQLSIKANVEMRNGVQLFSLYHKTPKAFDNNEKAALLVAGTLIASHNAQDYQKLRKKWEGKETDKASWFVLDVDKLLLDGKRQEAVNLLKSKTFTGKDDAKRLIRLALLSIAENPKMAWEYLSQAQKKDPQNPDIHTYRAKLLEAIDKKVLAESEFIAAVQTDPNNLILRDQLAEFYLRNKQYAQALKVWSESLNPPSVDFIWVKALFWNRVITPLAFDWQNAKIPPGKMKPFIEYLIALPPGKFWDAQAFDKLADATLFLKNLQSTFWLRLLESLKQNNEQEAWNLLQYNPFYKISWNPELEQALKRILIFRKVGVFSIESYPPIISPNPSLSATKEGFFNELELLARGPKKDIDAVPKDLQALLTSNEVFSAAFLAAGWFEAALQLHTLRVLPANFPSWVAYDYTQALQANRSNLEALQFAKMQQATPALSLLVGELYIASNKPEAALGVLTKLSKEQSDIGYRASWLSSLLYIEGGKYIEAKKAIQDNPKLTQDVLGKETLARIALLQGDNEEAEKMYQEIEGQSSEAKSYLARKAFADKNWKKAKQLTEDLLKQYPTNTTLQENLKLILQEEEKKANPK